jgi:NitT/TauT family transport system substrate-binding protein
MQTRARVLQALGGAVAAPFLAAGPGAAQAPAAIRLALIPIEPTCQAYYAQENGFFDKAGLDVQITVSSSTPAIMAAILTGTYDIAYSTVSTLATAHAKGLPVVIIAPSGMINESSKPIAGIVAGANSGIQTAKDFNGKTFGTAALNTLAEYVPRAWVDKHGGDSSTMKFVEIPFPQIADAMVAGRVDAGYLVEPFLSIATKTKGARWITTGDDAIAPVYLASCWAATAQWAKAHPDLVARFASAITDAGKWADANPAKVVPIIANHLKSDPAAVAATPRTIFADRLVAAQIQPWIDVTARYAKFPSFPVGRSGVLAARLMKTG